MHIRVQFPVGFWLRHSVTGYCTHWINDNIIMINHRRQLPSMPKVTETIWNSIRENNSFPDPKHTHKGSKND